MECLSVCQTYQESCDKWNDTTVGVETIGDGTHSVFTNTVTDIGTSICAQTSVGWLEVDTRLDLGQVTACQISRTTDEIGEGWDDGSEDNLGKFARSLSSIAGLVDGEALLPIGGQVASDTPGELGVFLGVLLAVRLEEGVPLGLECGTAFANIGVSSIDGLGDNEFLFGVKAELGLQSDDVVGLES